ncbi:GNAT family N-acetyltransferase [Anaerotignum sp.]|uniref:GNAT family N-acetyltransferase n=1 Tax=Anaerotignum sp. TaxID=2039241 RepID=UPI0027153FFC|nr:GNAT family N-acetyltransferase [Anaerotignum sp.]
MASYNNYIYWMLGKYFPSTCLVAEENGQVLGYIGALLSAEKRKIFIWQIAVKSEERGRQIGRKLLQSVLLTAGDMGIMQLEIAINDKNSSCRHMVEKLVQDLQGTITEKERYQDEGFCETVYSILIDCIRSKNFNK